MGKVIRNVCCHQNFVPKWLSVPALGLYSCIKSLKMCLKSYFKEIVLKLATNGQKWLGLSVDINICPQGVVCPCPGAIYMYKCIKIYTRTRCQMSVYRTTGPLVYESLVVIYWAIYWERVFHLHCFTLCRLLSHLESGVECVIRVYRFLIIAFLSTLQMLTLKSFFLWIKYTEFISTIMCLRIH